MVVTAFYPRIPSPSVDVTEGMSRAIPSIEHHNLSVEPQDSPIIWAIDGLNGRTTDVHDSPSAGASLRPEPKEIVAVGIHSTSEYDVTMGEATPYDPTIDPMINGQDQQAIKASQMLAPLLQSL